MLEAKAKDQGPNFASVPPFKKVIAQRTPIFCEISGDLKKKKKEKKKIIELETEVKFS